MRLRTRDCVDEKSAIQALDGSTPILLLSPGLAQPSQLGLEFH